MRRVGSPQTRRISRTSKLNYTNTAEISGVEISNAGRKSDWGSLPSSFRRERGRLECVYSRVPRGANGYVLVGEPRVEGVASGAIGITVFHIT